MNKFDLKDKLDKSIYKLYNILSTILYAMDIQSRHLIRKNVAFKDSHKEIGRASWRDRVSVPV
jgi:hypothetical protein